MAAEAGASRQAEQGRGRKFFYFVISNPSDVLKSSSISKLFRALKTFRKFESLFKLGKLLQIFKSVTLKPTH
jgi:hypothetical protein